MKPRIVIPSFLLLAGVVLGAEIATPPLTTEAVLKVAQAKAEPDQKAILVVFHASWCGWCKRLDAFLESSEAKPILNKYFVIEHLTVLERASAKQLENPGGEAFMEKLGGKGAGLPFFAMLDAKGKAIVSSRRGGLDEAGQNIGHPFQPDEVAWFMSMVKKAAPKMSAEETSVLEAWLQKQKRD